MGKINFFKLDQAEKAAIFTEIATQKGMKPFAETVTKAFDDFVSKHSYLSGRQLQF